MDDLARVFVSRYQLPTFPLPLFVSRSEKSKKISANLSIMLDNSHQSGKEPTFEENNYNKLDEMLFELDSFIKKDPEDIKNKNYAESVNNDTVRKTGSKATKRANQRRAKQRRERKHANKPNATPTKPKETNTSLEEFHDNKIIDYFSNLIAQVDFTLQAELEKIQNDDYGISIEEVKT